MRDKMHQVRIIRVAACVAVLFVSFLAVGVIATSQGPAQSSCLTAELRASVAEARLAAEMLKYQTAAARRDSLERELNQQRGKTDSAEQKASILSEENQKSRGQILSQEGKIADQAKTLTMIIAERNVLTLKIKKANGRWACEILHLGCIGEK